MATNQYIYVSSVVGTNTGASDTSQASPLTGAFSAMTASDVYDNIGSVVAGCSPSDGDTIYVADNHAASYDNGASYTLNSGGSVTGAGLRIISVDRADATLYKPGATDTLSDVTDDIFLNNNGLIQGVSISSGDNSNVAGASAGWRFIDVTIVQEGGGDVSFLLSNDGINFELVNVDIDCINTGVCFQVLKGGRVNWNGGALLTASPDFITSSAFGSQGGASLFFTGVDMSILTGTIMPATSGGNIILVRLNECRLNSSVTLHGTLERQHHRFEMFNCDDSTGNDFHRFYIADGAGAVQNNDATYVTATETWYEGSDKSSMEVTTTASCSHVWPFVFELPAQYVDLSQAASDVVTLELTTDLTLTDTDIAAFLCYPDGTTSVQANWVTSGKTVGTGNYGIDPLAAGTTLTTGSLGAGDWTGEPTSPNFYKMVLDTSGDAGQATAVSIRIEVYKASIAAGKLFIHPLLTLS